MWKINYVIHDRLKPKILLCETQTHTSDALAAYLKSIGFFVHEAKDTNECMNQDCMSYPDVILLDIDLLGSDGMNIARRLRRFYIDVPMLLFTANDSQIPFDDDSAIIKKPYLPKEIGVLLETLLLETKKDKFFLPRRFKVH